LGVLYFERVETERAKEQIADALIVDANNADVHYNLAVTLAKLGELAAARKHFERTIQINPGHAAAKQTLARINGLLERTKSESH
jgi:Tfp pilus assembly protein PilF